MDDSLISRQTAIDALNEYFERIGKLKRRGLTKGEKAISLDTVGTIKTLPPAQPEPTDEQVAEYCKRRCLHIVTDDFFRVTQPETHEGHWIDKGWNGDWAWQTDGRGNCWRVIECSECGKSVLVESNFCPHCGADMRGEQHETD